MVPNDVLVAAQGGAGGSGAGVAKYEVKWVSQAAADQRQVSTVLLNCRTTRIWFACSLFAISRQWSIDVGSYACS